MHEVREAYQTTDLSLVVEETYKYSAYNSPLSVPPLFQGISLLELFQLKMHK